MEHAAIITFLKLANNGYTFRRNMTKEERTAADAAVAAGLVVKRADYVNAGTLNDATIYYVKA